MPVEISVFINAIYQLPEEVLDEFIDRLEHLEYPRNYFLLKQGKTCRHLWFMLKGSVRYFYTDDDGKESNVWFSMDVDVLTDTPSFVRQTPAESSIQLLEDSELYAISYLHIRELMQKHHSFALWYIHLFEQRYVAQVEDRIGDLQFLNARQRYEKLLVLFPHISNKISLGHIASYLNITPETLSRIRAGKA